MNLLKKPAGGSPWIFHLIVMCGLLVLTSGCRTMQRVDESAAEQANQDVDALTIRITLDKSVYRPGEAIRVDVMLCNNTNEPNTLPDLDAETARFYFGARDASERMERQAVSSKNETMYQTIDLPPGQTTQRSFLLTRLTQYRGSMLVQTHYDPNPPVGTRTMSKIFSNPIRFEVSGEPLFERDTAGLILKYEAIRLAQAQANGEVQSAAAVLVQGYDGFYQWWVNLQLAPEAGPVAPIGYIVDPYKGFVRGWAVEPFDPKLLKDPRVVTRPSVRGAMGARGGAGR